MDLAISGTTYPFKDILMKHGFAFILTGVGLGCTRFRFGTESLYAHTSSHRSCDLRVTQQLTRRRGNCLSVSVSSSTDEAGLPHHTHSHVHRTVQLRFYLRLLRPTLLAFTSLMPRQSDLAITPGNHTWQSHLAIRPSDSYCYTQGYRLPTLSQQSHSETCPCHRL